MTGAEQWTLDTHGDSFEREWARHDLDDFPAFEEFWRKHLVPLSFRIREPENQFIRPSLPKHLVALADASYAVFYHVAHGHSAHEALLHFCCAVN
jgi:hypothetical protein